MTARGCDEAPVACVAAVASLFFFFFFFFQAEDGIRDVAVTGVQMCALPILTLLVAIHRGLHDNWLGRHDVLAFFLPWYAYLSDELRSGNIPGWNSHLFSGTPFAGDPRSEERRVGKECRSRWSPDR